MIERLKKNKLIVLVALIYLSLFIINPEKAKLALDNSSYYLIEMIQIMPVIFLLTVVIDAWVPKDLIVTKLGEGSGITGNLFSILLGSISAGPIYAAFPICKMLIKKGASIMNIIIILSAWAVIKIPMLANEAKFLGAKFMGLRWVLTVIAILIMAFISSKIIKKEDLVVEETSEELFKINVNSCIGCSICVKAAPEYFELENKKAVQKKEPISDEDVKLLLKVLEECPVKAISYYG